MRPDPTERHEHDQSGRIIYLGDVRRRKGAKRQSPDRYYLAALGLIALAGWAAWGVVMFSLSPSRLLSYLAFLTPLGIGLFASSTLLAYAVEYRRHHYARLLDAGRQGTLVTAVVLLNLSLLAAHHWVVYFAVGSVVAAVAADIVARRRV